MTNTQDPDSLIKNLNDKQAEQKLQRTIDRVETESTD